MRRYLRAANVDWDGLKLDDVKLMNFTDEELATYRLESGDIVLGEASGSPAEVGKPALWNGEIADCCFQNTLLRVRTFGAVLPKYLLHFLRSAALEGEFADQSRGVGIHHLGAARLSSWPITVPPLEEQRRIVEALEAHLSHLDAASSALRITSSRLAALHRSASAHLWQQSASAGPLSAVGTLGRVVTGSTPSRSLAGAFGGEVPFVTPSDVGRGGEVRATVRLLSERGAGTARVLRPGSVMVVCIGATLGKVGWSGSAVATNQQINGIELEAGVARPDFVAVLMASPQFQRTMWQAASSTTLPILNKSRFASSWLPLPPRAMQDAYMSWYGAISVGRGRLARDVDGAAERSAVLRRSLLTAAFSGRLVPQDPNDETAELLLKRIQAERATEAPRTRRTRKAKATP
jgi:type I restriction enzyme S subunit